jgi:ribosome recycling factor
MDIELFKKDMEKCIFHVKEDLSQIRTGRATPELVEDVVVSAYETTSPIKNLATITSVDSKTISIQPWDKNILDNIVNAVEGAELGFTPIKEGNRVLVKTPDLTEERRKEYVKIMKERVEDGRVAVRQVRQKYMKDIDQAEKEGLSEDEADRIRDQIEKVVKETNEEIEDIRTAKEEDLMSI